MAIIREYWYSGTYFDPDTGVTVDLGADNQTGSWPLTRVGGSDKWWYISFPFSNYTVYRYAKTSTARNGTQFYWNDTGDGNPRKAGQSTASKYYKYTGTRTVTVACGRYGRLSSPSIGSDFKAVSMAVLSFTDRDAHPSCYTCVAAPPPNSGTLLSRGFDTPTFRGWTWNNQIQSGSAPSKLSILISLIAGTGDAVVTANWMKVDNPASVWSPKLGNMVIHVLDWNLSETHLSTSYMATSTNWAQFLTIAKFTALSCSAGGNTRNWQSRTQYDDTAYLLNVDAATFSVTPGTGMRVYGWKLEPAPIDGVAQAMVDFGSNTSARISGFEEGCKVHLYLTSATPNPRILYEGFDGTDNATVPDNQKVTVEGVDEDIGKSWASVTASTSVTKTLAPVAWKTKAIGQNRSVLVNGATFNLPNAAGTSATVTSSTIAYDVTRVKFRQEQGDTDGELTLTIVIDAEEDLLPELGLSVTVTQLGTTLKTVTNADGSPPGTNVIGYYKGDDPIEIKATASYGTLSKSGFILTLSPDNTLTGDSVDETDDSKLNLMALRDTRALTVTLSQAVFFGNLTSVDVNLTRDTSRGKLIARTDGPITDSFAGQINAVMTNGQSTALPISVQCMAKSGYLLKSVQVLSEKVDDDGRPTQYLSVPATSSSMNLKPTIPRSAMVGDAGPNIRVVLVMEAVVVKTPQIEPLIESDRGKFTALLENVQEEDEQPHLDYRVGDTVTLNVTPVNIGGSAIDGIAIGSPVFDGTVVTPTREGTGVSITVPLKEVGNVFKIPTYATFIASSTPAELGIGVTPTWDTNDILTVDEIVYYRLGSRFTVAAPLSSDTFTAISAQVKLRIIKSGPSEYLIPETLTPVIEDTTAKFTSTLKGQTQCVVAYAEGVYNPKIVFAAYDYGPSEYISEGERPNVNTKGVSPAVLSNNILSGVEWPVSDTPGMLYRSAAFLVQEETHGNLLPQVSIHVVSKTGSQLEIWDADTETWIPYASPTVRLISAFTFFRVTVGVPPSNLVDVSFRKAVYITDDAETEVAGCRIYATSAGTYDTLITNLPAVKKTRSRTVLHVRGVPPDGYVITGWLVAEPPIDEEAEPIYRMSLSGASISVAVPDTGLLLKPVVSPRVIGAASVMVLNAAQYKTDHGIWVSKLFRSPQPWRPLTAHVISRPVGASPILLSVMKDGRDAPEKVGQDNLSTVSITIEDDKMRRLPPGQIQKTRFVRYMVSFEGDAEVSSIAIGSGAQTMKRGH